MRYFLCTHPSCIGTLRASISQRELLRGESDAYREADKIAATLDLENRNKDINEGKLELEDEDTDIGGDANFERTRSDRHCEHKHHDRQHASIHQRPMKHRLSPTLRDRTHQSCPYSADIATSSGGLFILEFADSIFFHPISAASAICFENRNLERFWSCGWAKYQLCRSSLISIIFIS